MVERMVAASRDTHKRGILFISAFDGRYRMRWCGQTPGFGWPYLLINAIIHRREKSPVGCWLRCFPVERLLDET